MGTHGADSPKKKDARISDLLVRTVIQGPLQPYDHYSYARPRTLKVRFTAVPAYFAWKDRRALSGSHFGGA